MTNVSASHTVTVTFVPQFTISPSAGSNGSISPNTPQAVNSGNAITFTATPSSNYIVNQWLVDNSVVQTGGNSYQMINVTANHTLSVTFKNAVLIPSVSSLGLSVNCPNASACAKKNDALTGNSRQIIIQNLSSINATNVSVVPSGLPTGTSIISDTCTGTLNMGNSCTITITPGDTASSDVNNSACSISNTQPTQGIVSITADGGLSEQVNVYVLNYGCQYQGGFIYAVDDTTPNTGSIGGKVAALVDQAAPRISSGPQSSSIIWSSNGNGATSSDVNYRAILGIDENATANSPSPNTPTYPNGVPSYAACSPFDGLCATENIVSYYNYYRTTGGSAPTPLSDYAAGLCKATINSYSDWYLPATCEMNGSGYVSQCADNFPADMFTQNMRLNLFFLIGDPSAGTPSTSCSPPSGSECLAGIYLSSTECSPSPNQQIWGQRFDVTQMGHIGGNNDLFLDKSDLYGVRCARELTP